MNAFEGTINVIGTAEVLSSMDQVFPEVKQKMMAAFKEAADATLTDAQDRCPYDAVHHRGSEPHLRDTGRIEEVEDGYNVTFGDESGGPGYSLYVELGHRTRSGSMVPPQPYLMPAFTQAMDELPSRLEDII
jgi:hypothetical protein